MGPFNLSSIYIFLWDTILVLANLILPRRRDDFGFGGKWPEYIPSKQGDSRCSCPALNALANHSIIAHDGRNISFVVLAQKLQTTYNISPTFCAFILKFMAGCMRKDYSKDVVDLRDFDAHDELEHDGSLVRNDIYFEPDTAKIATALVEDLLHRASGQDVDGKPVLTCSDLSKFLSQRLADCEATNPEFSQSFILRYIGWGNAALLRLVFGGKVEVLRPFLLEERIADGWAPWNKRRYGVTLGALNVVLMTIALRAKAPRPATAATSSLSPDDNA